jgi:F0F1-type ATP synthase membrane subunit b/b'
MFEFNAGAFFALFLSFAIFLAVLWSISQVIKLAKER